MGLDPQKIKEQIDGTAEGVNSARELHAIASRERMEMPITEAVFNVLAKSASPEKAVSELLARLPKEED